MWLTIIASLTLSVAAIAARWALQTAARRPRTREELLLQINHRRSLMGYDSVVENALDHIHGIAHV